MVGQSNHSQFVIILLVLVLAGEFSLIVMFVGFSSPFTSDKRRRKVTQYKALEQWSSDQKALPSLAVTDRRQTDSALVYQS